MKPQELTAEIPEALFRVINTSNLIINCARGKRS